MPFKYRLLPVALLLTLVTLVQFSCKPGKEDPDRPEKLRQSEGAESQQPAFPAVLDSVLRAHGGLEQWRAQRTLVFDLPKGEITETHTADLYTRHDRVDTDTYSMGYDGKGTWILDPDGAYEGNPEFYHNLMFYFYAMPFVLADPGIVFGDTPNLEYEGISYPGLSISYNDGVGTSPEDEYYFHYDPDTYQMVWLGYTVTYHSGEASDDVHWIRYGDWDAFNGLVLPRSITWHNYEGRDIGEARNTVRFENVVVSELQTDPARFRKPEEAVYFEASN